MNGVKEAIYARLTGDAALTALLRTPTSVFDSVAPAGSRRPYVIVAKLAGTPDYTFRGHHDEDVYLVKAVDQGGSSVKAEAINDECVRLLHNHRLVIDGAETLDLVRESDVDYAEDDKGEVIWHIGSRYRLRAQPT